MRKSKLKRPWHHKDVLNGMYHEQGLTVRQIAEIFNVSAVTVRYWLAKFNIERRKHCIGNVTRGKHLSSERKKFLSEFAKKRFITKEDHPMYGRKHSLSTRRKMSESQKKRYRERKQCKDG